MDDYTEMLKTQREVKWKVNPQHFPPMHILGGLDLCHC